MRRNPTRTQRERLLAANGHMCCVCKAVGVGLELHHIDGNHANTVDENIAVLCVSDHDAHHRPNRYPIRHVGLGAAEIVRHKQEWEAFIREAQLPEPRLLATVSGYGALDYIHATKVVYQWTTGKIAFERIYHQLTSGDIDDWTTDIVEECARIGRKIPLVLLTEPLDVAQCPCCRRGLSNVIDRGYALRLSAPHWERDSIGAVYINPDQPSLALNFALKGREVFSGHLHLCRGTHLHFICDDYDERRSVKRRPSVRSQVTKLLQNFLKNWKPGQLFIGTGDPDDPHLIDGLRLPNCWEAAASSALRK
jgi:hypothetical protein